MRCKIQNRKRRNLYPPILFPLFRLTKIEDSQKNPLKLITKEMKKHPMFKKKNGMILIDNYWIEQAEAEKYLLDRSDAIHKATVAMDTFCEQVKLQWAGSEDGEAIVGYNTKEEIQSLIHLTPSNVATIMTMNHEQLIQYLKEGTAD